MSLNVVAPEINAPDALDRLSAKPNFLILAYGANRIPENVDSSLLKAFPPDFMFGTVEDRSSQSGMLELYSRLYRSHVPVEAHFFQNGVHGTGFAIGDPVLGQWTNLLHNWLAVGAIFNDNQQIELAGVVKLDGEPLAKGIVIMTPVADKYVPPVVVHINKQELVNWDGFSYRRTKGRWRENIRWKVREDAHDGQGIPDILL